MWINNVTSALVVCTILSLGKDKSINASDFSARPPYHEYARVARYLVHKSNWTLMGTISSVSAIHGYPMVNVISIEDIHHVICSHSQSHREQVSEDLKIANRPI